jgi:hypothetical protein
VRLWSTAKRLQVWGYASILLFPVNGIERRATIFDLRHLLHHSQVEVYFQERSRIFAVYRSLDTSFETHLKLMAFYLHPLCPIENKDILFFLETSTLLGPVIERSFF